MFYDSQIANNVMIKAIDEYQTVVLPIHDNFICVEEFKDHLRELMAEEYIEVMRPEVPPGIDMKPSDYYMTGLEKSSKRNTALLMVQILQKTLIRSNVGKL